MICVQLFTGLVRVQTASVQFYTGPVREVPGTLKQVVHRSSKEKILLNCVKNNRKTPPDARYVHLFTGYCR